jgi:hypothetical protein
MPQQSGNASSFISGRAAGDEKSDIMIKDFNVSEKGLGSYWLLGILRWVMVLVFISFGIQKFTPEFGTFAITWSFFFTTPGVVKWSISTDPIAWNLTGEFLTKISSFFVFVSFCFWHHYQRKSSCSGRVDVSNPRRRPGKKLLDMSNDIRVFIAANEARLKSKG